MAFAAPPNQPAPPQQPAPVPQSQSQSQPGQAQPQTQQTAHPGWSSHELRPAADVLRPPQALALALILLLALAALVNLFSAGVSAHLVSLMGDKAARPASVADSALDLSDVLASVAGVLQTLSLLATMVVFLVWFHRVRVNGEILRPDAFTRTRGWAIGGWFIPVGNLFIPFRIAKEIWAASTQLGPDGSYRHVSTAPVTAWWTAWVASLFADRVFDQMFKRAETAASLRDAWAVGLVCDLLTVAAAVLAALFVRKLTSLQHTKAVQGPYAQA
ncbi:DUF4328 domain-containing protein [Streptomyces sp. NPDC044571]|uniref:DUF4328 domain-containing protein n=1 Tax=Streptomyces sp. NPDC044571 TaxID=3155371 RepID=UPI0033E564E6